MEAVSCHNTGYSFRPIPVVVERDALMEAPRPAFG
jgi:hypothetical protein